MKLQAYVAMVLLSVGATAMAIPAVNSDCQAAKTKAAGDYVDCRQTAEAKYLKSGDTEKYTAVLAKCDAKLAGAYTKAETKADGTCPTNGDAGAVQALATQCGEALASSVETGGSTPSCGDGAVNVAGEHCDGLDLGGATCASLAYDIGDLGCTGACKFAAGRCSHCPEDTVGCGGTCVDTSTDVNNCGACGNACVEGQFCTGGACFCESKKEAVCGGGLYRRVRG